MATCLKHSQTYNTPYEYCVYCGDPNKGSTSINSKCPHQYKTNTSATHKRCIFCGKAISMNGED